MTAASSPAGVRFTAGFGVMAQERCGTCARWHKRKHYDCQHNGPYGGCLPRGEKWKERWLLDARTLTQPVNYTIEINCSPVESTF